MIQILNITHQIDRILEDNNYKPHKIIIEPNFSISVHYVKNDTDRVPLHSNKISQQNEIYNQFQNGTITLDEYVAQLKKIENDTLNEGESISIEEYILNSLGIQKDTYYIEFRSYTKDEFEDKDSYLPTLFQGDTIESLSRYRLNGFFDNNPQKIEGDLPPVVTFYSYKGGMARTTTMIAYAIERAAKGAKVFIIDCDLEAPGYLNFFDLSKLDWLKSGERNGLVEMISDISFTKNCNLSQFNYQNYYIDNISKVNEKYEKYKNVFENIFLMPAGNLNETDENTSSHRLHYLEGLSRINLSNPEVIKHIFTNFFTYLKSILHIDLILIDSRTGFSDIIFNSIKYFSKHIVAFFGSNEQSIPGLLNLLDEYYNKNNSFELTLINSILPSNDDSRLWESRFNDVLSSYQTKYEDTVGIVHKALHRFSNFEKIGIKNDINDDTTFIETILTHKNQDYDEIFDELNVKIFDEKVKIEDSNLNTNPIQTNVTEDNKILKDKFEYLNNAPTLNLRNNILQNLKETLKEIKTFAEESQMDEKIFYYRDCMNDLFNQDKFLIRGYKGTGKTYLYLALENANIRENLLKRAIKSSKDSSLDNYEYITVQVINTNTTKTKNKFFNFDIFLSKERLEKYNFTRFWQLHTWNSILLEPMFKTIREESRYSHLINDINGASLSLYDDCLSKDNFDLFVAIEEDMVKVNNFLKETKKDNKELKMFLLYDQLDSRVNPIHWSNVISPLINFWKDYHNAYSNILPKIFVRTDLMSRILGTNTERLENNFIEIEWDINEIFNYFIKLTLVDDYARYCLRIILMNRIKKYQNSVFFPSDDKLKGNQYQLDNMLDATLSPFVYAFFGSKVVDTSRRYWGNPYQYFQNNLCNADKKSISLRPFINTLNNNAIEQVLREDANRHVTAIIPCKFYANKEVRDKATKKYFEDLTRDEFSEDLKKFIEFLNYKDGDPYRFKTLNQNQYENLLNAVFKKYESTFTVAKQPSDLNSMLEANGIICEKTTREGKYYQFAPLYYYVWALKNSKFDTVESKEKQIGTYSIALFSDGGRANYVITYDKKYIVKYCDKEFKQNQTVIFDLKNEPSGNRDGKLFWYATNLSAYIDDDNIEG